jgi:hypothetical protein
MRKETKWIRAYERGGQPAPHHRQDVVHGVFAEKRQSAAMIDDGRIIARRSKCGGIAEVRPRCEMTAPYLQDVAYALVALTTAA